MKNFKFLLAFFAFLLFANMGFSQNAKMQQKAADKTEKLNQMIVSINPGLALSEEQASQITGVNLQKMMDVRALKKTDISEEEMAIQKKALTKTAGQKINKEILTKEQRQAKKEARAAAKG